MARRYIASAAALALLGCSAGAVPGVRFANAPAVRAVDDRRDVPRPPRSRTILSPLHHIEGYMSLVTRPMALPRARRALGVNALDEVPDSTWFTNRIGVRALSPDEVRVGSGTVGSPEPYKPWTVHSTKVGGATTGFLISDARGERFLLKFERAAHPEVETGAAVIANRILWAAGYNVPEDHVVYLRPRDLVLAPDAKVKDLFGDEAPLDRAELERRIAHLAPGPDGRLRGIVSRLLEGESLGGHPGGGVRADDPNDRIPHELRRDLRGSYALYAWLDLTDVKEDNTLDMWVEDPADPRRHYVKHYLVDFGKGLGTTAMTGRDPRRGLEYKLDVPDLLASFLTLGTRRRAWEDRVDPGLRGVGLFDVETYDPGGWKPDSPAYLPFRTADELDKFWASKIIMRFTREHLRAAVETARFSDPRAAAYVLDTLVARQRATARHWFERTSPLDRFEVAADRWLCFDDLMLQYRLAPVAGATTYTVASFDRSGRRLGPLGVRRPPASASSRTCAGPVTLAGGDGYTILRVETARPGHRGTTFVHVAREPDGGAPRVIGVWRP